MDIYSNYVSELKSKLKLRLTGQKSNENLYSGWEINKISYEFNEIYYKSELLRSIEELIKNGTSPSDIWIMDKSFDINKKYVNYSDGYLNFNNAHNLKYLYFLGTPTPLYTNKKALLLSIVFDAFRKIYSISNKYDLNIPSRTDNLNILLDQINDEQLINLTEFLRKIVFDLNKIKDLSLKDRIINEINQKLENDNSKFEKILNLHFEDNTVYSKKIMEFDKFNYLFNSLDRPVVVENKRSRTNNNISEVNILCSDFLVSEKYKRDNPRFLETNLISQNSPLVYIVSLSFTILPSLILILKKRQQLIITKKDSFEELTGYDEKIRECEIEIDELDLLLTALSNENDNLESEFKEYKDNNRITEVHDGNNDVANEILKESKDKNINKGLVWLNINDLKVDSYEKSNID